MNTAKIIQILVMAAAIIGLSACQNIQNNGLKPTASIAVGGVVR